MCVKLTATGVVSCRGELDVCEIDSNWCGLLSRRLACDDDAGRFILVIHVTRRHWAQGDSQALRRCGACAHAGDAEGQRATSAATCAKLLNASCTQWQKARWGRLWLGARWLAYLFHFLVDMCEMVP